MDDGSSGRTSLADSASLATASLQSGSSSQNIDNDGLIHIYNYRKHDYQKFSPSLLCEEICTAMCRHMEILPAAVLLFGIREHNNGKTATDLTSRTLEANHKWQLPGEQLSYNVRYCLRMRFRVPELDRQLSAIDAQCQNYLYHQMRYDMLHEQINEIRYPEHKDQVMGLAVMDMMIDKDEKQLPAEAIERTYKSYLPHTLWRAHRIFVWPKIRASLRKMSRDRLNSDTLKMHYVYQVCHLAPTYLTEQYKATVEYLPNESATELLSLLPGKSTGSIGGHSTLISGSNATLSTAITGNHSLCPGQRHNHQQQQDSHQTHSRNRNRPIQLQPNRIPVYVRLCFHDSPEPGLKVARVASEATLKWSLVAVVEDIFSLYIESDKLVRLESVGFPKGYYMRFETEYEMKSFISYLSIYSRLTVKWMQDLCPSYKTPSLQELERLYCHGPIGGGYSFGKLRENGDKCGSYIVRQCEREYNTYYIDINTKIVARDGNHERCHTETFKIIRKDQQWELAYQGEERTFDELLELAKFIRTDSTDCIQIAASKYDRPSLLLLLLPKNLKSKKTDAELSEDELQRRNPQLFIASTDLRYYPDSVTISDDGNVFTMKGDWIQHGTIKDVPVTMKMMVYNANLEKFTDMVNKWSRIQSPQFIKLHGLTLSSPYLMVLEYSEYGPLNKFLQNTPISMSCLLDVMHGLVRGIHYLDDNKIIHNYIRCANLHVTKYNPDKCVLDAKISDPGYPRPYKESDLPWIPRGYIKDLKDLDSAKQDSSTQLWAFATTVYEIFSRGKIDLTQLKKSDLQNNITHHCAILEPLHELLCPPEIHKVIMDGWSDDSHKRFNHHDIFTQLSYIKKRLHRDSGPVDELPDYIDYPDRTPPTQGTVGGDVFLPNSLDLPQVMPLEDCKVIYLEKNKIGQGHYGTVYKGEIEYNNKDLPKEQVAIKKLKSRQVTKDFQREMSIMRKLDHPNVVKFKYWAETSLSIIMEYFEFGSFVVYLKSYKPTLTNTVLLNFALDIARGMNYLSAKGLIHRDLAARNVLVDRSCVKISDFGLSQFANADGYYIGVSNRDIPIKWFSPEALETSKFSSYSDVWSYGVTLFEMFSRGEDPCLSPGHELTLEELLNRLRHGERLPKPELCTDFVYNELMRPCFHETPKSRPTFQQIIQIITREMGDNVAATAGSSQQQQQQQLQQQMPQLLNRSISCEDELYE